jgi:phage tail sheath gpL-like
MHAQATVVYGTPDAAEFASGSITYGVPVDGDTVIVNGTTLTKAAAGGAAEFSTIGELEALIEALTGINSSENGTVITITAASRGAAGNAITLALGGGNTGTMAISGATLTGGVTGSTITVDGNTFTCVASGPGGTEFTSAAELATLIDAISGVNAANSSGTITINADAVGTAGNSKAISKTGAGLTLSGATLTGGAAALYTDVFTMDEGLDECEIVLSITALGGTSPTVDVTPQVSYDGGVTWIDAEKEDGTALAFPQKSATGNDQLYLKRAAKKVRGKIVLGGTSPTVTGSIYMNGRQD